MSKWNAPVIMELNIDSTANNPENRLGIDGEVYVEGYGKLYTQGDGSKSEPYPDYRN